MSTRALNVIPFISMETDPVSLHNLAVTVLLHSGCLLLKCSFNSHLLTVSLTQTVPMFFTCPMLVFNILCLLQSLFSFVCCGLS